MMHYAGEVISSLISKYIIMVLVYVCMYVSACLSVNTHSYLPSQIGHRHVVDATLQEKACSVASLLISVTHKGLVTCVRKLGGGSLDPESIFEMTEVSQGHRTMQHFYFPHHLLMMCKVLSQYSGQVRGCVGVYA